MKPAVQCHFAHANGFPAGSYQQVFSNIPDNIRVFAKPQFAHDVELVGDNNWTALVDELIAYCEQHKQQHIPLWAVGHSMGGIVSFKAACKRPDLFDGLIMLDPPLVTGIAAPVVRLLKKMSLIDSITPAKLTSKRKQFWRVDEDRLDYFCEKPLFSKMRKACIEDYVDAGTVFDRDGFRLVFDPQIETMLFRHIPDDLNRFKHQLKCPGYLVLGENSNVCKPGMYKPFARHHNLEISVLPGGHMFPMEHPEHLAELLERVMVG